MTSIIEFKNGLDSVMNIFFSVLSEKIVNGRNVWFPKAEMYYDIRELEAYTPDPSSPPIPVITMLPSVVRPLRTKCEEGGIVGVVDHLTIPVTCYIKMLAFSPLTLPDGTHANHKLLADYTWEVFQLVVNTQVMHFNSVNIFSPMCDRYPLDSTDEKETVLVGTARFNTEYFSYKE